MKSPLLDHISQAYNIILSKYGEDIDFIIAGDKNDLKLDQILSLSNKFRQVVVNFTRFNPPAILDPIITTLSVFYQVPKVLPPLDPDPDKTGVPSDHHIPVMRPINNSEFRPARTYKEVKVRPMPQSALKQMKSWLEEETWSNVLLAKSSHEKAEIFQKMVKNKLDQYCPEKVIKFT